MPKRAVDCLSRHSLVSSEFTAPECEAYPKGTKYDIKGVKNFLLSEQAFFLGFLLFSLTKVGA